MSALPQLPSLRARSRMSVVEGARRAARRAASSVHRVPCVAGDDAHDIGAPAALLEEAGDGVRQQARALEAAEAPRVLVEARHRDRHAARWRQRGSQSDHGAGQPGSATGTQAGPRGATPTKARDVHALRPERRRRRRPQQADARARPAAAASSRPRRRTTPSVPRITRRRCLRGRGAAPPSRPRRRPWRPASGRPTSSAARCAGGTSATGLRASSSSVIVTVRGSVGAFAHAP